MIYTISWREVVSLRFGNRGEALRSPECINRHRGWVSTYDAAHGLQSPKGVYCPMHVTRLAPKSSESGRSDRNSAQLKEQSGCFLVDTQFTKTTRRNQTLTKAPGPRAIVEDSQRGVALQSFAEIIYYNSKDTYWEKSMKKQVPLAGSRRDVENLSWWHRHHLARRLAPSQPDYRLMDIF